MNDVVYEALLWRVCGIPATGPNWDAEILKVMRAAEVLATLVREEGTDAQRSEANATLMGSAQALELMGYDYLSGVMVRQADFCIPDD